MLINVARELKVITPPEILYALEQIRKETKMKTNGYESTGKI